MPSLNFARCAPLLLLVVSCSTTWLGDSPASRKLASIPEGVAAALTGPAEPAPITALRQYRLTAGDDIEIVLAGSNSVLGVATVSAAGTATLPRRGETKIVGLTLDDVGRIIEGKNDAPVRAHLRAPAAVNIIGAVGRAGTVPYQEGLTLQALLAEAGGATHKADLRTVFVTPKGEIERSAGFDPALPILPGDTVRLKERYF